MELKPSPRVTPGAHTALTREPDAIDLFAAETGASLAKPFTCSATGRPRKPGSVRQEVQRHCPVPGVWPPALVV